jgi:hypothetical protein
MECIWTQPMSTGDPYQPTPLRREVGRHGNLAVLFAERVTVSRQHVLGAGDPRGAETLVTSRRPVLPGFVG